MSAELVMRTLERSARDCPQGHGHGGCETDGGCGAALEYYRRLHSPEAASFDARHQLLTSTSAFPDETWSTSALLLTVKNALRTPPWRDGRHRTLVATSALARLGERGIPVGAVMRTCLGEFLVRHVATHAAVVWVRASRGELRRSPDAVLEPWLKLLDGDVPPADQAGQHHVSDVIVTGLRGELGRAAGDWVATATVTHLLGWRLDGEPRADVVDADLALAGGEGATRWIIDRFTETYLDQWHASSLQWEIVYQHDPEGVALRVGLPLRLLQERAVTQMMVIEAFDRRLTGGLAIDPVAHGLKPDEVVESVVTLLRDDKHEQALELARRASRAAPENPMLLVAKAFCLIPFDTDQAEATLNRLAEFSDNAAASIDVDRATVGLARGDLHASELAWQAVPDDVQYGGWFWDPRGVVQGEYVLRFYTFAAWRSEAQQVLSSPT